MWLITIDAIASAEAFRLQTSKREIPVLKYATDSCVEIRQVATLALEEVAPRHNRRSTERADLDTMRTKLTELMTAAQNCVLVAILTNFALPYCCRPLSHALRSCGADPLFPLNAQRL
jgi:hypothetical protein